jgi:hypothetical protein
MSRVPLIRCLHSRAPRGAMGMVSWPSLSAQISVVSRFLGLKFLCSRTELVPTKPIYCRLGGYISMIYQYRCVMRMEALVEVIYYRCAMNRNLRPQGAYAGPIGAIFASV